MELLLFTEWKYKGKYFGQKFKFFPPPGTKICQFLPCFFTPVPLKIFITYFKWREAPKIFHFLQKIWQNKASDGAKRRKFSIFYTKLDKIKHSAWNCVKKISVTNKRKFYKNSFISMYIRGYFLYGGTRKLSYFLNGIRKNFIWFGGFRKVFQGAEDSKVPILRKQLCFQDLI